MNPALVIAAAQAAKIAFDLAMRIRDEARKTGSMTPDDDAVFDQIMQARMEAIHWRPTHERPL